MTTRPPFMAVRSSASVCSVLNPSRSSACIAIGGAAGLAPNQSSTPVAPPRNRAFSTGRLPGSLTSLCQLLAYC